MKTIFDHIERVKGRPHHVRKQIAFASAAFLTAFIALVWFVGSWSAGAFSVQGNSFTQGAGQQASTAGAADKSRPVSGGVAGVGAASALSESLSTPAHIEIVDASTATSGQKRAERTTIPF